MFSVMMERDAQDKNLWWLMVTHNGLSWSSIQLHSDEEIRKVIAALQASLPTLSNSEIKEEEVARAIWLRNQSDTYLNEVFDAAIKNQLDSSKKTEEKTK